MRDNVRAITFFLALAVFIAVGIYIDIYRWQSFNDIMDKDVGYWQWKFVFDLGKK